MVIFPCLPCFSQNKLRKNLIHSEVCDGRKYGLSHLKWNKDRESEHVKDQFMTDLYTETEMDAEK